jgi:thioredoxin 2
MPSRHLARGHGGARSKGAPRLDRAFAAVLARRSPPTDADLRPGQRTRAMPDPVHVVCPKCDATNRVPAGRLAEAPKCGACGGPLFDGRPVSLSEPRIRHHLGRSGISLLVDFWASWCGPCRAMAPAFEAAARTLEPRVRLAKVSTEEAPRRPPSCGSPAYRRSRCSQAGGRWPAKPAPCRPAGSSSGRPRRWPRRDARSRMERSDGLLRSPGLVASRPASRRRAASARWPRGPRPAARRRAGRRHACSWARSIPWARPLSPRPRS